MPDPYRRSLPGPIALPANPYEPDSSEWWLFRLSARLDGQFDGVTRLDAYYRGANDTFGLASQSARESGIAQLFAGLNANLAKLVVDAAAQRLVVFGFRLGDTAGDEEAWRIWQANDLDEASQVAHRESMVKRTCPVLVEPNPGDPSTPRVTVQDPLLTYVETAPSDARIRRAALKRWRDDDGSMQLTLYLPDRIEKWRERRLGETSDRRVVRTAIGTEVQAPWLPREPLRFWSFAGLTIRRAPGDFRQPNPLGEVPLVPIRNMPRVDGSCEAEHEAVLPLLDLYNKTLLDMAVTAEFGAFPQRYGIGVELDEGEAPETVEGLEAVGDRRALSRIRAAVDAMITTPTPDAQFGQFPAADLGNYVKALDHIRSAIGTITFTPYHLLLNMPSAVPATGEALKAAEVGLVTRCEAHQVVKGNGWEQLMRLAFRLAGDEARAAQLDAETIWKPPATLNETAHMQALRTARQELGLPLFEAWAQYPASPSQIRRWRRAIEDEYAWLRDIAGDDYAQRTAARLISGGPLAEPPPPEVAPLAAGTEEAGPSPA